MSEKTNNKTGEAANAREQGSDSRMEAADRRQFLKNTGVTVLAVGAGVSAVGMAMGQSGDAISETIKLDGATPGWTGTAPSSIEGETNPTLTLQAGRDYTIVWTNIDGQPHNVVINDDSGNSLVSSEIMSNQGQTQQVDFTASKEMVQYLCQVHPTSMVGDVSTVEGSDESGDQAKSNETAPQGNESNATAPAPVEADNESSESTNNTAPNAGGSNYSRDSNGNRANYTFPEDDYDSLTGIAGNDSDVPSDEADREARQKGPLNSTQATSSGGNGKAKTGNGKAKTGDGTQ